MLPAGAWLRLGDPKWSRVTSEALCWLSAETPWFSTTWPLSPRGLPPLSSLAWVSFHGGWLPRGGKQALQGFLRPKAWLAQHHFVMFYWPKQVTSPNWRDSPESSFWREEWWSHFTKSMRRNVAATFANNFRTRWGNGSMERLNNLLKVTQRLSDRAKIWLWLVWLPCSCSFPPHYTALRLPFNLSLKLFLTTFVCPISTWLEGPEKILPFQFFQAWNKQSSNLPFCSIFLEVLHIKK